MNEKPSKWKVFTAGIIRENPVLRLVLGCCLPILASRLKLDPAVMASPLITTVADAVSLFVYFRIAVCLLKL